MTMSFAEIPFDVRTPGAFLEVDPSLAESGVGLYPLRSVLIAQRLSTAPGPINTPIRVSTHEEVLVAAGAGSMAERMAASWFAVNRSTELWVVLLDDLPAGTQAVKTVTFSGTPGTGVVALYIAGDRYTIDASLSLTAQAAELADILSDPTNGQHNASCPFTAAVNPGDLTQVVLTAKNAGLVSDTIDVRHSHLDGESLPAGLSIAVADSVAGAGDPDITSALTALAGVQYDIIAHPYIETANLVALEADLDERALATNGIPGLHIVAHAETQSILATIGSARNSEYGSFQGLDPFPGVPCERGAAIAAAVAFFGSQNPSEPFQGLELPGYAPSVEDQKSQPQRNMLLHDGVSTTRVVNGRVQIERLITTNQTNDAGAPTTAFLDVNRILQISWVRKAWPARLNQLFPRHSLADDSTSVPIPAGQNVVTPKVVQGAWANFVKRGVELGIFEDAQSSIANSVFQRSGIDPNRVDMLLRPNFRNQARIFASKLAFTI